MRYRALGATGLEVSVIGYGASPLGSAFRPVDEGDGIRAVRTALDLGVNFIDVSPYYGAMVAESVLGRALRGVDRDSYVLATKVGRYGDAEFDFSAPRVIRSVDESLARLGVDHVDLIQCHDIEFGDLDQVVHETLPALRSLRDSGKVRFVGVTGYSLPALGYVVEQTEIDTILTYCRYTLADRDLTRWLPLFERRGVGVVNASPLCMGLLSHAGPPDWHPAPAELRRAARQAVDLCALIGQDIAKVALQFAIAPAEFAGTIVGSADAENIARNIAWAEEPLDQELAATLTDLFAAVPVTSWPTGRPENSAIAGIEAVADPGKRERS